MRNVVDSLVEERKWLNKEAYEKLMEMPYGVMKVKDYRNSIKLEKGLAGDVQPADITKDADGNYLVTSRAKKAGAVKITASCPDQNRTKEVYFTLSITDEFSIDTNVYIEEDTGYYYYD